MPKLYYNSSLLAAARRFWYNNEPGTLSVGEYQVTRQAMYMYGGPSPEYACEECQRYEWLSRVFQRNMFREHKMRDKSRYKMARNICSRQGKEEWTHNHQNFMFSTAVTDDVNAPRVFMLHCKRGEDIIFGHYCDQSSLAFMRTLARACQYDLRLNIKGVNWANYDLILTFDNETIPAIPKGVGIPIVVYLHDLWKYHDVRQARLTRLSPDYIYTPYPIAWERDYKIPDGCKIYHKSQSGGQFFTRPNLNKKGLDLILLGTMGSPIYSPRVRLAAQIRAIPKGRYKIKTTHAAGSIRARHEGPNIAGQLHLTNAYSAMIGTAKFAMFGEIDHPIQTAFMKHYELLGSGAIPIFPDAPVLKRLGVKAGEHFIPIDEVRDNNRVLMHYLDNYDRYKHIAANAVEWHKEHDRSYLFETFENIICNAIGDKYPRRVLT